MRENVEIVVQFGALDEHQFRAALNRKDGPNRVKEALDMIRVVDAHASVASDKELIADEIKATIGTEEFDTLVRDGLIREYRRISAVGMSRKNVRTLSGALN